MSPDDIVGKIEQLSEISSGPLFSPNIKNIKSLEQMRLKQIELLEQKIQKLEAHFVVSHLKYHIIHCRACDDIKNKDCIQCAADAWDASKEKEIMKQILKNET